MTSSKVHWGVAQGLTWFTPEEAELLELLRRWTIAFSRSAMCHLREDADLETHLKVRLHLFAPFGSRAGCQSESSFEYQPCRIESYNVSAWESLRFEAACHAIHLHKHANSNPVV